jgi:hypothetical protein
MGALSLYARHDQWVRIAHTPCAVRAGAEADAGDLKRVRGRGLEALAHLERPPRSPLAASSA